MNDKNKSLRLIVTSLFSLTFVIVLAFGSEIVMGERDESMDLKNEGYLVPDIDVFGDISFVDLNKSEEDFSSTEMSENVESEDNGSVFEELSVFISEDFSIESDISFENSKSEDTSKENLEESSEVSEEKSEEQSSSVDVNYPSDVILLDGVKAPFVYFQQDDPKYENIPYGTDKIGSHGCGPVNMAMIISTYTGNVIYPDEAAKWSYEHGYWSKGTGTSHSLMTAMANAYGVPVKAVAQGSWTEIITALKQGKYVITRVKNGIFAKNNHFFTLRGITDDGKILVANSISYDDSVKEWDLNTLKGQVNLGFWVYG